MMHGLAWMDDPAPDPGEPVPPPAPARPRQTTLRLHAVPASEVPRLDRGARLLALLAVGALAIALVWAMRRPQVTPVTGFAWERLAPPVSTPLHPWRWIVLHHAAARCLGGVASSAGTAQGEGFHFLIGDGAGLPLGLVDAGFRWRLQQAAPPPGPGPELAAFGRDAVSICLQGDYQATAPDPLVERRLVELCAQLLHHVPTLAVSRIVLHRDVQRGTTCPGGQIDLERLRFLVREELMRQGLTVR
jgi:hypothetical protein